MNTTQNTEMFINSEGDVYAKGEYIGNNEWKPASPVEQKLDEVWNLGMSRFRNWTKARAGESGSEAVLCWLPNAYIKDGKVLLLLVAEFGGVGNDVNPRDGLPAPDVLRDRLNDIVTNNPAESVVQTSVVEIVSSYFEVCIESEDGQAACAHAISLSMALSSDTVASAAHEVIL